ncbi:MAG: hypothetical protein IK118_00310 [Clostridia bacterium]|nr:hypothetical protein [Clostridia bacterium]
MKILKSLTAVALCLALLLPLGATAFADSAAADIVHGIIDGVRDGSLVREGDVMTEDGAQSIFSGDGATAIFADVRTIGDLIQAFWKYLRSVINSILSFVANTAMHDGHTEKKYLSDYESEHFYAGTDSFITEPGKGWSLGYANLVFTPEDLLEHGYYMGGYDLFKVAKGNLDDLKVRAICMEDGSGRGVTAFAVIDTIGLSNYDTRLIRARVEEWAAQSGAQFNSINVAVSHTHSGLDTQGIWASPQTWLNNLAAMGVDSLEPEGVDPALTERVISCTAQAIEEAFRAMEPGKLYYASKNEAEYFNDKSAPTIVLEDITRLRFVPSDKNSTPTIIANFGSHPETVGLKTNDNPGDKISSDFLYYTEQILNKYGYNFILLQGGLGSLISAGRGPSDDHLDHNRYTSAVRYGWEIGYLLLGMTMSEKEIEAKLDGGSDSDIYYGRDTEEYTLWYEDWEPATETEVAPILNIRIEEVVFEMDNPILVGIGKLGFASNVMLYGDDGSTVYTVTEVGYLELGRNIKVAMMPGEVAPELVKGGKTLTAEGSAGGEDFTYGPMKSYFDDDTVLLVFDVMNDSTGYIIPDNDYGEVVIRWDRDENAFTFNTDGMLSFGTKSGSIFVGEFLKLAGKI